MLKNAKITELFIKITPKSSKYREI